MMIHSTRLLAISLLLLASPLLLWAQAGSRPSVLYRNCGNPVKFDFPPFDKVEKPNIVSRTAGIAGSQQDPRKYLLVPQGDICIVGMEKMLLGKYTVTDSVTFPVLPPPAPTVQLRINDQPWGGAAPMSTGDSVRLAVVPDSAFFAKYPQDARYEIDSVKITVTRADEVLVQPALVLAGKDARWGGLPLPTANWQPGDTVTIQITVVNRKNFQGKRFPELALTEAQRTFTVVVQ